MLKKNFLKYFMLAVAALFTCLSSTFAAENKLRIIYIPLDDRPVCSAYVEETMAAVGAELLLPPAKLLASGERDGDAAALWQWLEHKAPQAAAAVLSCDSLLYGGLTASRTHHLSPLLLEQRLAALHRLPKKLPLPIYLFSTVMRTPRASFGRVEPPYYSELGPAIFAYSRLLDRESTNSLTYSEKLQKAALERNLHGSSLNDWLQRRKINFSVNQRLIAMAAAGNFPYLAIGKDDNAPLSATHMETRRLARSAFSLPKDDFQIIDGVDQLGLLLLARAFCKAKGLQPSVCVLYAPGAGAATLPQYSDSRLQDSVPEQIEAAGAHMTPSPAEADLLLAVNTPFDGQVKNTTADDNKYFASPANKIFIARLQEAAALKKVLSLADISYANGADNGFMHRAATVGLLERLAAYNGWNTADNAVGYAIAQGLLAPYMKEADRRKLLTVRLIDDWFYQSNARQQAAAAAEKAGLPLAQYQLGSFEGKALAIAGDSCRALARSYPFFKGRDFTLSYPWHRLFEAEVKVK